LSGSLLTKKLKPAGTGPSGSARVTVTDGKDSVSFSAGDFVVFPEDLECTWQVHEPVKKHYSFG
jgi:uncharacterized cupin superfamily protein